MEKPLSKVGYFSKILVLPWLPNLPKNKKEQVSSEFLEYMGYTYDFGCTYTYFKSQLGLLSKVIMNTPFTNSFLSLKTHCLRQITPTLSA